ncbi:PREDICTED: pyrimidodiazepine synthase-like [Ceratosolen solmsi marchali]|uniref:Glutathione-dependent dehydroascorbate reductase n=1 Tax=Ceratosolen solmsi marchali TaxID=326594 RepID=A0AAJ6YKE9_9HYME|nr:PREDICTED: pyrimidodiazepine synthase-like [Ceratosolen solmsi marchali]
MSILHLGHGSEQPPKAEGKIRLYSMKYCPFAHRVRLALSFKKLSFDIVNINLKNKPEWYLQIHPEGKVPALVNLDGKVLVDSTAIVNYLEEEYPEPPLYNKETITKDLELLDQYDKIVRIFSNCIHKKDNKPFQEAINEISNYLVEFEEELKIRKTPFFTGKQPGMLDILMWPFVERSKALPILCKESLHFEKEKFPFIMKWILEMKNQDFVKENAESYELFAKVVEASNAGVIDYDNV